MNNNGIALLTGLMLLAALSLLAVLAASSTLLQRKMAANFREGALALETAAIASSFANAWLLSRAAGERDPDCRTDCVLPAGILNASGLTRQAQFEGAEWWRNHGYQAGYDPETAWLIEDPDLIRRSAHWLIEEIHVHPAQPKEHTMTTGFYRILARGEGRSPRSVAVLETIVARPWADAVTPGLYPPAASVRVFCSQFESQQPCGVLSWRRRR